MRSSSKILACALGLVFQLSLLLCACSYSHQDISMIDEDLPYTVYFDIELNDSLPWEEDTTPYWKAEWGSLGYDIPESYHLDYFYLPQNPTKRTGQRNLFGDNNYITLYAGEFELLIYNNDFDYITVDYSGDEREITATTSLDSQCEISSTPDDQEIRFQPDKLFTQHFTLNLHSRTPGCSLDASGKKYNVNTSLTLSPITKIYLIAVRLSNNSSKVIDCTSGIACGLASAVEVYTGTPTGRCICHALNVHFDNDWTVARLICFGPAPEPSEQSLWLWLKYANGTACAKIDLTQDLALHPDGGLIIKEIDIERDYPTPDSPTTGGGGMSANVSGWEGEENYYIDL